MTSSLRDVEFRASYRSGADNLSADLFAPAIAGADTYERAAGFFSSSVFEVLGDSFARFFARGCHEPRS